MQFELIKNNGTIALCFGADNPEDAKKKVKHIFKSNKWPHLKDQDINDYCIRRTKIKYEYYDIWFFLKNIL